LKTSFLWVFIGFQNSNTLVTIVVNSYGTNKGVDDIPLETGRVWYNPFTEDVYEFPTYIQTRTWTKSVDEGSPVDESITFNSIEGAIVNADVSIAFQFIPEKVPYVFKEFRKDADYITNSYVRSQVRDAISKVASTYKATDIFGSKKQEVMEKVKKDLNEKLNPRGFKFDMISFIGGLRADANVVNSINAVITAAQKSIEAETKVKQIEMEAKQKIAEAEGEAQSKIILAESQAKANELITKSVNDELIMWEAVKKWDGKLPQATGGSTPLINLK
jgi:regulator of protease activity HflC (stomatin/prohibitin superfamily)